MNEPTRIVTIDVTVAKDKLVTLSGPIAKGVLHIDGAPAIPDPVAKIDQLLLEAKAAPRFRNDTYDAIDRLDATMFGGDEFMASREVRQHFRYYLARWEKQLRSYDEFDAAMDGTS